MIILWIILGIVNIAAVVAVIAGIADAISQRESSHKPYGSYEKYIKRPLDLSTYFKYPEAVRTLIYTTNTIEGFNRQLPRLQKTKAYFR